MQIATSTMGPAKSSTIMGARDLDADLEQSCHDKALSTQSGSRGGCKFNKSCIWLNVRSGLFIVVGSIIGGALRHVIRCASRVRLEGILRAISRCSIWGDRLIRGLGGSLDWSLSGVQQVLGQEHDGAESKLKGA